MTSKYLFKKLQTPKEANLRKFLRAISSVVKDTNYANADHTYKTDANGRVNLISGKLELKTRDRNTYQQSKSSKTGGIKDGRPRDDGGHLIASTFSGAGEQINCLPMDSNLNRSALCKMENEWRSALKAIPPQDIKSKFYPYMAETVIDLMPFQSGIGLMAKAK